MINNIQSDYPLGKISFNCYALNQITKIFFIILIISFTFLSQLSGAIVEGSLATIAPNQSSNTKINQKEDYYDTTNQSALLASSSIINTSKKIVTITAYSSTPDQTDDTPFITASNTIVRDGVIAANFLEFGTRIRIPTVFGNKIFIVEDRMHRRYSDDHIDIWFPDRESALKFGVQKAEIEILP